MNNFFIECEKSLFKLIVGIHERQGVNTALITNGELIDNLYEINDETLNNELNKFKQLPLRIQQSAIIGLEVKLQEYFRNKSL